MKMRNMSNFDPLIRKALTPSFIKKAISSFNAFKLTHKKSKIVFIL